MSKNLQQEALIPILIVALAGLSGGTLAAGQEHEEQHHSEAGAAEHEEHELHRHHFSVFLGVTDGEVEVEEHAEVGVESEEETAVVEDESTFTLGLDYEYRLNRRWGIGALIDYAGGDFRSWVAGVPLFLHPGGGWKLLVAPGFEDKEDEDREFLVRAGVLYDFEARRLLGDAGRSGRLRGRRGDPRLRAEHRQGVLKHQPCRRRRFSGRLLTAPFTLPRPGTHRMRRKQATVSRLRTMDLGGRSAKLKTLVPLLSGEWSGRDLVSDESYSVGYQVA